jgi:hypothetical protein
MNQDNKKKEKNIKNNNRHLFKKVLTCLLTNVYNL